MKAAKVGRRKKKPAWDGRRGGIGTVEGGEEKETAVAAAAAAGALSQLLLETQSLEAG